jgi:hypothetical protein
MSGYKFLHKIVNGVIGNMLCDVRESRVLGCCRRALLRNAPASSAGQARNVDLNHSTQNAA